jgi:pyrroline-5-carboxylate reductase
MTVITPPPTSSQSSPLTRQILLSLFTPCGRVRFLDEKHFDACTALAGSGPAFVALVLEAMADGGVMMGLPRAEALELAAQSEYWLLGAPLGLWLKLMHSERFPGSFCSSAGDGKDGTADGSSSGPTQGQRNE